MSGKTKKMEGRLVPSLDVSVGMSTSKTMLSSATASADKGSLNPATPKCSTVIKNLIWCGLIRGGFYKISAVIFQYYRVFHINFAWCGLIDPAVMFHYFVCYIVFHKTLANIRRLL